MFIAAKSSVSYNSSNDVDDDDDDDGVGRKESVEREMCMLYMFDDVNIMYLHFACAFQCKRQNMIREHITSVLLKGSYLSLDFPLNNLSTSLSVCCCFLQLSLFRIVSLVCCCCCRCHWLEHHILFVRRAFRLYSLHAMVKSSSGSVTTTVDVCSLFVFIHAKPPLIRLVNPENPQIIALFYTYTHTHTHAYMHNTQRKTFRPLSSATAWKIANNMILVIFRKANEKKKKLQSDEEKKSIHQINVRINIRTRSKAFQSGEEILFKYFRDWLAFIEGSI